MRKISSFPFAATLVALSSLSVSGQESTTAIQQKLESQYALTQPTGDDTDIVTAGAVLVLQRGGGSNKIMMAPVSSTNLFQNMYKDGKVSQNALGKSRKFLDRVNHMPGMTTSASDTRTFVPGEKMWVTKIDVKDDGVIFDLFTDAYSDIRYKAFLKFQFAKGSLPPLDQVEKTVAEVFKVQPSEDTSTNAEPKQQSAAGKQQAPAANALPAVTQSTPQSATTPPAPIPPPPAPLDAPAAPPKSMSKGQTTDEVVANFGAPEKIVKLGTKQIYVYKDMKVTFVAGKVTDVQ